PQMDKNTYLAPPAQVTWVEGGSGGDEDSDSELSLTACLNRFSVLQSSPSPPPSTTLERYEMTTLSDLKDPPLISETPSTSSAVNEDQPEPELSSVPEPVKPEPVVQTIEKPARSEKVIVRKSTSFVEEFLHINNSKKLQCLHSDASSSEATLSEGSWSPGELRQQMMRLLLEDMASDEEIFNCVKEKLDRSQMSSSPYLRELMTAVCKAAAKENTNCRVHTALIQKRLPVLLQYRNSESEQQLHALQELQALIVTLDQPPTAFGDTENNQHTIITLVIYLSPA
ncbi:unnamed protein product, partial [Pleuronectes platessa]